MADFSRILADALKDGTLLLLVLSKKRTDSAEAADKLSVRPVTLQGERRYQFAFQSAGRETHENLEPEEAERRVNSLFGVTFADCHLYTSEADYSARVATSGAVKLRRKPPSRHTTDELHDRKKNYLIPEDVPCPFLVEIGVMTPAGKVRAAKYHKFRQINRFLELVEDAIGWLRREGTLQVVDFGCGKSYLTFALDYLLQAVHGRDTRIVGLDRNAEIVRDCEEIVGRLGCRGLEFQPGDIADFRPHHSPVDLVISLHACDTATDDALAQAIRWQADVILAVPCCQHELAEYLDVDAMPVLLRHGILKERFAALATDALRAQVLEISGYKTQVVEFIDMEHTAKNLMIRAIRRKESPQAERGRKTKIEQYQQLKQLLGIEQFYLERVIGGELFK